MLAQKFTLLQTTIITWLAGFVLVWIALWNCAVLPLGILPVVVPLSLVTIFITVLIARKLQPRPSA
jgi:RsiW-degrading membrane proteinase PrsW (M82 family)